MNTRYPHKFEILSSQKDDDEYVLDADGHVIQAVTFSSICGLRTDNKYSDINSKVVDSDYKLAMPYHTHVIQVGDSIKFTNLLNGEVVTGKVIKSAITNFGCNVWFNCGSV